ncbi:hypothetical protein D2Q93_13875 [Alicyclobacillaceae bacterium I2511]|nr:hypothetical protein D2Q93_13875 [Alicyclobacillaceae bacterium I2511]
MDEFHEQRAHIREDFLQMEDANRVAQIQAAMVTQQTQKRMGELLLDLGGVWAQGDDQIGVEFTGGLEDTMPGIPEGLDVTYGRLGGTWISPKFSVTTTCTANHVEVMVSDGHWDSAANVHGNWATWTDQRRVYQGDIRMPVLRRRLQEAFLSWYKQAVSHGHTFLTKS